MISFSHVAIVGYFPTIATFFVIPLASPEACSVTAPAPTSPVAGFLIAFLGGSRVQISGPTAAFATIVAGIVATDGMEGLVAATIIAGVMLVLMGLLKLGTLIRFVPYTMTTWTPETWKCSLDE